MPTPALKRVNGINYYFFQYDVYIFKMWKFGRYDLMSVIEIGPEYVYTMFINDKADSSFRLSFQEDSYWTMENFKIEDKLNKWVTVTIWR